MRLTSNGFWSIKFMSFIHSLTHSLTHSLSCRAELGQTICSYWQRLKHSTNNVLREALQYATKKTPFLNIQQNEEINKKCKVKEPITQQHIKNARLVIKKTLRDQYLQNWLETQNRSPTNSREKLTHREIKNNH